MGQGAESCGGYDIEYDEYDDVDLVSGGIWTQRDGSKIRVSDMTETHLKNTMRICAMLSQEATFECDQEKWQSWVDIIGDELSGRAKRDDNKRQGKRLVTRNENNKPRGRKIKMICKCGKHYEAREADLKRGWGLSCSKSCAAHRKLTKKQSKGVTK